MANTKVTSRVLANDAVLTANIADDQVTTAKIADDVALGGNPTTTTQSAGNNTTRIATTAFVTTAVANIVDSAPSALDTLNELAAALGDDANFSTTVTNSIAAKLPLAGGTMTGNIAHASDFTIDAGGDISLDADGGTVSLKDGGTEFGFLEKGGSDKLSIKATIQDADIAFFGNDGGSEITALTLDMSDAGSAYFNNKVGIGTTSPSYRLTAKSDANTNPAIKVEQTGNTDGWGFIPDNTNGNLEFSRIGGGTAGTHLAITNSGNVGIGTQSPSYELHVEDDASETTIAVRSNIGGTGSAVGGRLRLQLGAQNNSGSGQADTQSGDTLGQILFEGQGTDYSYQGGSIKTIVTTGDGDDNRSNQATAMIFGTIGVGSVSETEKLRITSQGTIGISGVGSGSLAGSIIINNDGETGTINNAYYNTVLGWEAADDLTSGDSNTIVGNQAGYKLTEATGNTLIGRLAGEQLTTGSYNTAIGFNTMGDATVTGASNTAVGNSVMVAVTSGAGNTALGEACAAALTTGSNNVAIGRSALSNGAVTGSFNIALGYEALRAVTSGGENVCLGRDAGHDISSGTQNVAVGHESLTKMSSGTASVAVGFQALEKATGSNNTGIGYKAGENITSGTNNMMLGKNAGTSSSPIGAISTSSNNICLGDDNIGALFCVQSSINTSDRRDKTDIENFTTGLDFINKMQPVTYKWDRRSWYLPEDEDGNVTNDDITKVTPDGSKKEDVTHVGFIAQDVETLEKEIGYANDNSDRLFTNLTEDGKRYGMKYERLVTVLVNSVKELSTKLDAAEARIKTLEES